jgi:hypothetical protein
MAGVLKGGEVFATGEVVSADRLNRMVDEGTIMDNGISNVMIGNAQITERHLDPELTLASSMVGVANGKLLGGGPTNEGQDITPNAAEFEITSATLSLKTAGISQTKLAGGILATQLAGSIGSDKLTPLGTAGTYGSASQIPVITTDVAGRVSAVALAAPLTPGTIKVEVPAEGVSIALTGLPASAASLEFFLHCKLSDTRVGYVTGDRIPLSCVLTAGNGASFSPWFNGTTLNIIRFRGDTAVYVMDRRTSPASAMGSMVNIQSGITTYWQLEVRYR